MAELPPGVVGSGGSTPTAMCSSSSRACRRGTALWLSELGHLVLGHEGISIVDAAAATAEVATSDLISYMLNQRTGCMGPNGEDIEQEAEDFAALLLYRLGRLPSDPLIDRAGTPRRGIWLIVWVIAGLPRPGYRPALSAGHWSTNNPW